MLRLQCPAQNYAWGKKPGGSNGKKGSEVRYQGPATGLPGSDGFIWAESNARQSICAFGGKLRGLKRAQRRHLVYIMAQIGTLELWTRIADSLLRTSRTELLPDDLQQSQKTFRYFYWSYQ